MKRFYLFVFAVALCLCGCLEQEEEGLDELGGLINHQIVVLPKEDNYIGKQGGDFVIVLTLPDINGEKNPNALKNEFFTESYNLDAPFVKVKGREQVDDRTVRYTFSFEKNTTGQERTVGTRVMDTTYVYKKHIHGAIGAFAIHQSAE